MSVMREDKTILLKLQRVEIMLNYHRFGGAKARIKYVAGYDTNKSATHEALHFWHAIEISCNRAGGNTIIDNINFC